MSTPHTADDWLGQAEEHARNDERADAGRCLDEALRLGAAEVWVHRRAAAICLDQLADRKRATAVLTAYERRLAGEPVPGYEWQLLAEGWLEILRDRRAARRCLHHGRKRARSVADHCSLAQGHAELLGDHRGARQLLLAAEERAREPPEEFDPTGGASRWWDLANRWLEIFDDEAHARQSFDEGLARATSAVGCKTLARGWASHAEDNRAEIRACLERGRELAQTFADWFDLAATTHELLADDALARQLLQHATPLATDPSDRQELARAWRDWLGDPDAAAAVGPTGVSPVDFAGSPDAARLFDWLRQHLTDDHIEDIAASDGGDDLERHRRALLDVARSGLVPTPMAWHPGEVVALYRWREDEGVDHVQRAFCGVLLVFDDFNDAGMGIEPTWAVLLESCAAIGADALDGLHALAEVAASRSDTDDQSRALALLVSFAAVALRDGDAGRGEAAAARCLAACAALSPEEALPQALDDDLRSHLWRELFDAVIERLAGAAPSSAVGRLLALLATHRPRG